MAAGGALAGIRVLDVGRFVAGPLCATFLAALGAEVIRVLPPGGGESWRFPPLVGPDGVHGGPPGPLDIPMTEIRRSRGKRSVTLDYGVDEGRELFLRLAATADVVVENYRPGVLASLGVGYDDLRAVNPRLVWCAVTGYGQQGPSAGEQAMDPIIQARSGLMAKTGFPDGPPVRTGATIGDQLPATFAALGVMAALRQRDEDGMGRMVDVAMLDVLASVVWDEPVDHYRATGVPERLGNADSRAAPLNAYATADGWVVMVMTSDRQWPRLLEEMGRGDLASDQRVASHAARGVHRDVVDDAVGAWTATRSTESVLAALRRAGVPAGPVRPPWGGPDDPQLRSRGALVPVVHPATGATATGLLAPRFPVHMEGTVPLAPAETLGASTEAVLGALGLGADDLAGLRARGVI